MNKKLAGLIILFLVACDQLSKGWILQHADTLPMELTPFFNLVLVWNKGVSFGLLNMEQSVWVSYLLNTVIISIIGTVAFMLIREKKPSFIFSYSLILGGALGNLMDRIMHGKVVDFLDFYIGTYHWPAFNVADSAIVVGVALYLWSSYKREA